MPQQTLDHVVQNQILTQCADAFVQGAAASLVTKQNLDPFGLLNGVRTPPLEDYDFTQVTADKAADFLAKMDLRAQAAVPAGAAIAPAALTANAASVFSDAGSGPAVIPRLQHAIWVGKPLNNEHGTNKMKDFMAQLAANQRTNNPANNGLAQHCTNGAAWQVVLWTDQPRAAFADPGDPAVANMKEWAAANHIRLVSIDEVFGDEANRMQLHTECRLEQNKAGTGRAAASDIIRLEVLNRFGGVYVDGDKPFRKDLDEIARQAVAERVTIGGVQRGGFASASEGVGRVQNCALCSEKGGAVIQAVLDHVQAAYTQSRETLMTSQGNSVIEGSLPQRIEVITRSGPSAIQAVTGGNGLMTPDSLQSYTGTTSWTQEEPHAGYRQTLDPLAVQVAHAERLDDDAALQTVAARAPALPALPAMAASLNEAQQAKIAAAIKGGVTSLAYTMQNEAGRLDLRHLTPHLEDFSEEEKQTALHGTVQVLASPAFAGMRGQINSLIPPPGVPMTADTLALLTTPGNFPQLRLDNLAMQRAALHGDVALLKYGADHGVSLEAGSAQIFDTGTPPGMDPCSYRNTTPLRAAVEGGQLEAAKFILSQSQPPGAAPETLRNQLKCLERAGELGRTEMLVALSDAVAGKIALMPEGAARQEALQAFDEALTQATSNHLGTRADDVRHLDQRFPRNAVQRAYEMRPQEGERAGQIDNLVINNAGPLAGLDEAHLRTALRDLGLKETDIQRFVMADSHDPKTIGGGMREAYQQGEHAQQARRQAINAFMTVSGPDLLARLKQAPLVNLHAGNICAAAINEAARGSNRQALNALVAGGHDAAGASEEQKTAAARNVVFRLDELLTAADGDAQQRLQAMLTTCRTLGIEDDVLKAAARANRVDMITASLNAGPREPKVPLGQCDMEAHNAVAHYHFPNSEAGKNDYQQITAVSAPGMSREEVLAAAQKALAYSHDRLRAGSTGAQSRIEGWRGALELLKQNPNVVGNRELEDLLHQTQRQMSGVNSQHQSVRDSLRAHARTDGGPDISARHATSRAGKLREFFRDSAPAVHAAHPAVPGKRV